MVSSTVQERAYFLQVFFLVRYSQAEVLMVVKWSLYEIRIDLSSTIFQKVFNMRHCLSVVADWFIVLPVSMISIASSKMW